MARTGSPDDPNNYSDADPTQYANYGGTGGEAYSEYDVPGYQQPPPGYQQPTGYGQHPPPPAWHQRPAVLVGLGVLTAALLALLVYAIVQFTNAGSTNSPSVTSTSTAPDPATSQAPPPPGPTGQTETVAPSSTEAPPITVTSTVTPTTTAAPTTSEAPAPSTTTSVTTVTETTTKPFWPTIPRPTPKSPTLTEPAPGG